MNTRQFLQEGNSEHIHVRAYGSATLIPNTAGFASAENIMSPFDFVSMTNPLAFAAAIFSKKFDVKFLPPSTKCPYKEHGFLENTYLQEIKEQGDKFADLYLAE